MKKLLRPIFFSVILTGGVMHFSGSVVSPPVSRASDISIAPPSAAVDFSDLDARDSLNRPIKSGSAKKQLENLFARGLNELIMFSLTPAKRHLLILMGQKWNAMFGVLRRSAHGAAMGLFSWIREVKNKFITSPVSFNLLNLDYAKGVRLTENARTSFQFLVSLILSSTCLLR